MAGAPERFSWEKRGKSFVYAFQGLGYFFRTQHNGWIHAGFTIGVLALGWFFDLSTAEWLWIVFCIGFVFSAELMNTAIEAVVDLVSPDYHELAGKAKDVGAAAVLVAAITSAIIGLIIFVPKVLSFGGVDF